MASSIEVQLNNNCFTRSALPRKAKEQALINKEQLSITMECIDASTALEENPLNQAKPRRTKGRVQQFSKTKRLNVISKVKKKNITKHAAPRKSEVPVNENSLTCSSNDKSLLKSKKSVFPLNKQGLSHFMELGERTDLLCSSQNDDPLGPDSFENCQLVDVKQEYLEDVEISKITLTELPLKPAEESDKAPQESRTSPSPKETNSTDNTNSECESWDQDSTQDSFDLKDSGDNEENSFKKNSKNRIQECDVCGKKLSSKGSLRLHKMKKHKLKMQFSCDLCELKFDFQREVMKHRNSVHREEDGGFCCNVCNKMFIDYYTLMTHIKRHAITCDNSKESENICSFCNKSFDGKESLKSHQSSVHGFEETEIREKLKHQEKNFTCDFCGKRFAFHCLLRDHINLHTGAKPYLCQKCGKAFAQKATLKQHSKTHSETRPYQCSECALGFFVRGDLKKHLRKHTGERPYTCEVCGQGFSRSSHLGVHRRSHTGERPYECDVCRRAFTKRGDVVRHRRIHTGELPYLCQVCGRAFRQSTQCANHVKSQHPDSTGSNFNQLVDNNLQRTYMQLF